MDSTASLIIGHTTERCARIWVRGDARHAKARIRVERELGDGAEPFVEAHAALTRRDDYTAVVRVQPLAPDTRYRVVAEFAATDLDLARGRGVVSAQGRFRTFPPEGSPRAFGFLHGSCNLSIVSLTNVGSLALGLLGLVAATRSLERPTTTRWRLVLRLGDRLVGWTVLAVFVARTVAWAWRRMLAALRGTRPPARPQRTGSTSFVKGVFWLVLQTTRWKQPRPVLPSPFTALLERLDPAHPDSPAFMIHGGDQIYYDVPDARRAPKLAEYRLAYREAFFDDPDQRAVLASCPHYMTLDDHELVDAFALDHVADSAGGRDADAYAGPGLDAYREYVHARHPAPRDGRLWYEFQYGACHFMVLDTRSERHRAGHRMLSSEQMQSLKDWLAKHEAALKFVVSSVPFLAELRAPRDPAAPVDEREDKWAGRYFRGQRDELLEFVHANQIGRLVFLVGDMHCAYHATMRIGTPERRSTIHELAGGPIHQLEFARRGAFHDDFRGTTRHGKIPFRTALRAFHGAAAGVLEVKVRPGGSPELCWSVVRTSRASGGAGTRSLWGRIDV